MPYKDVEKRRVKNREAYQKIQSDPIQYLKLMDKWKRNEKRRVANLPPESRRELRKRQLETARIREQRPEVKARRKIRYHIRVEAKEKGITTLEALLGMGFGVEEMTTRERLQYELQGNKV